MAEFSCKNTINVFKFHTPTVNSFCMLIKCLKENNVFFLYVSIKERKIILCLELASINKNEMSCKTKQ